MAKKNSSTRPEVLASAVVTEEFEGNEEAGESIPTIELSVEAEVNDATSTPDDSDRNYDKRLNEREDNGASRPMKTKKGRRQLPTTSAEAVPVGSLMSRGIGFGENSRNFGSRAEFISVALIKPSVETELGLSLSGTGGGIFISGMTSSGLIAESGAPVNVGDRLISVNNISCDRMDHKRAAKLLRRSSGTIVIVARNPKGGNVLLVESMITKPSPTHQSGIGFSSAESSQVNISNIFADGLFAQSLLSIGDEVLSINGLPCRQLNPSAVADIVRSAEKYLTVVAKKFQGNGVVIATSENVDGTTMGLGLALRQRHKRTACHLLLCSVFVVTLVALIIFILFS